MAEIVNLRAVKKAKAKAGAKAKADENAVKFGRRKEDKAQDLAQAAKAKRDLDGHKRE